MAKARQARCRSAVMSGAASLALLLVPTLAPRPAGLIAHAAEAGPAVPDGETGRSTATVGQPFGSLVPVHVLPRVHLSEPSLSGAFLAPEPSGDGMPPSFSRSALAVPQGFIPPPRLQGDASPAQAAVPSLTLPAPADTQAGVVTPITPPVPAAPPLVRQGGARPAPATPRAAAAAQPHRAIAHGVRAAEVRRDTGAVRRAQPRGRERAGGAEPAEHYDALPELAPLPSSVLPVVPR